MHLMSQSEALIMKGQDSFIYGVFLTWRFLISCYVRLSNNSKLEYGYVNHQYVDVLVDENSKGSLLPVFQTVITK